MTEASTALREPWERLSDQRAASTFAMWAFIASEFLFFGAIFAAYTFTRVLHPTAFAAAASHTNFWFGTANTAILLCSSFTMVMGARAASLDLRRAAAGFLTLTALLGLAFLLTKGLEYRDDLEQHLFPGQDFALPEPAAQIFFSFYWGITAVHAIHMTIGIALVSRLAAAIASRRLALRSPQVEVTSLYWGLVDIIWLIAYPLLYLVGRQ